MRSESDPNTMKCFDLMRFIPRLFLCAKHQLYNLDFLQVSVNEMNIIIVGITTLIFVPLKSLTEVI